MRFAKKTAVVTGGSSGIGKAIVERLQAEGAHVFVLDVQKPTDSVDYFCVDIRDEDSIKSATDQIPSLDILVNNAGIYFQKSVENTSKEELDCLIDINLKGPFLVCKHFLKKLKQTKGNIVNVCSTLGIVSEPSSPAYCSSKSGLIMLTKCLAQEYAEAQIRVNAVLPGPTDTPLLQKSFSSDESAKKSAKKNPLRRFGTPEEVANVVAF